MTYYPPRYLFRRYELLRKVSPGNHFLEIGAGRLQLSVELLRYYAQGTVVDFSPLAAEAYNQLAGPAKNRLTLMTTDFMDISFTGASLDAVVACEVLEHVENEAAFLGKIHSLLKPGGLLLLSVPARKDLWSSHDELAGHFRRYEKVEIVDLLSRHRLKPLEVISYGFPFVHLFRIARLLLADRQYAEKSRWSKDQRTKESSAMPEGPLAALFGLIANPLTFRPLCLVASLFNSRDWSDGYLITCEK